MVESPHTMQHQYMPQDSGIVLDLTNCFRRTSISASDSFVACPPNDVGRLGDLVSLYISHRGID